MSKQNRRTGKSFSTLGQRMLSFGRGIMRTYANETSAQPSPSNEPSIQQGQWRSMSNKNLIWRQEQATPALTPPPAIRPNTDIDYSDSDYSNYDDMGEPLQAQPQPRRQPAIQRQPEPQPPAQTNKPIPSYIKSSDGTPVKVSRKQFPNDLQRRLESIAAAHQEVQAERDQKRDKKVESIQRKVDSGEVAPYRRRGSIDVDYVKTESLLPPEERGKPNTTIQTERQDSSQSDSSTSTTDSKPDSDGGDDSEWFDEIPDDDANIDNLAGFESSEDDIQRMPDDLPRFDASSLNQEEPPDDMGEFESGSDSFSSQTAPSSNPSIDRDFEDNSNHSFDGGFDSPIDSPISTESTVQRTSQNYMELPEFDEGDNDETVPLVPHYDGSTSSPSPSIDTPVQGSEPKNSNSNTRINRSKKSSSTQNNVGDDNSADLGQAPPIDTQIQRQTIQRDSFEESDVIDDFGESSIIDTSSANDAPVQRQSIQRDSFDDFSDNDDFRDSPRIDNTPSVNDAPVQRQSIQRDSFEDDFSDNDDFRDSPRMDNTPSVNDAPVQRQTIQRDSFDDFNDNDDFRDSPRMDNKSSANDAPVQRQSIQRDSFEESDDIDDFGKSPRMDNTPSVNAPVQRQSIQRDSFDDDFSDNDDFRDSPRMDSPSANDAPVQRQSIQRDSFEESDDNDDFGDSPSMDSPSANDAPVQRQTIQRDSFDESDDNNDFGESPIIGTSSANDAPVQRQSIQRDSFDDDFGDNDDFGDSPSMDSPSANDATVQRQSIQRDSFDESDDIDDFGDSPIIDTSSANDASVQRQSIQRDSFDDDFGDDYEADFSQTPSGEYGGESDYQGLDSPSNPSESANTLSRQSKIQRSPSENTPIQRRDNDHPDLGDGGEYSNFGNETWAEQNDYSPISDTPSSDSPIQRTHFDEATFDDNDDGDGFDNAPSVNSSAVQRDMMQDADFNESDFDDYDNYEADNFGNSNQSDTSFEGVDSVHVQPTNDISPVQRQQSDPIRRSEMDERSFDDLGMESLDYPAANQNAPVQRSKLDSSGNIDPASLNMPIQGRQTDASRQSEMDERSFDDLGMKSFDFQAPAQEAPVQRRSDSEVQGHEFDEYDNDYDNYGNETWAEQNNYSPASDHDSTTQRSIQRDIDHSASSMPQIDNNFDHLEDTDGATAMNILDDYLTDRHSPEVSSSRGESPTVQRAYEDETYDYLPEDFDPSPTIYDFNQAPKSGTPPSNNAPIQRSADDMGSNDQPIDLFQAMSQAGMIKPPSPPPQTPIQRDYQANEDYDDTDDYSDYGNATWAEANNYTPPSDNVSASDIPPVQRTAQDGRGDNDQPMDLFQAMSQAGMIDKPQSGLTPSQPPIQRKAQDESGNDLNNETMDLYNAMIQSGMIKESGKTNESSSSSEPVQRSPQFSQSSEPSMMDLLSRATQPSDTSGVNSSNSGNSVPVNMDSIAREVIQRDSTPVTSNEINREIDEISSNPEDDSDDKDYIGQIAKDVFRIIKRRLREEKERRG